MIPLLPRITREAVSSASGTASLVVWIFAQTPQIYQNFRTKSVEGLSFVFLLQWTLGDLTNLVGAFLTNQLLIQMIIAAYMLLVDVTLCTQYALYYREPLPPRISPAFPTERSPLIGALYRPAHTSTTGTMAMASTSRSLHVPSSVSRQALRTRSLDPWMVYRVRPHRSSRRTRAQRQSESTDQVRSKRAGSVERGRRSKAHASWAPASVDQDESSSARGRARERKAAIRRGATVALLSVGFFISVGPTSKPDALAPVDPVAHPRVLTHTSSATSIPPAVRHPFLLYIPDRELWTAPRRGRTDPAPPFSVIIGRIFAWFCTVLYMTSRLPQIWTNFQRRSVQGLSMLLFLLAFFANLLYSISILSNPKAVGPDRYEYLSESLPFLLGSSGTLIFDLVILVQYAMWHDKHTPAPSSP
ncbi:hypothetical protein MARU1_000864 [Malassezia arunalokei]|uniref:Uncharacterized protein n=1 Tax=Malassezia arunalokei TaxID=1514897 RepID=A0AAJ5Z4A7_9BASI|nr:hypothetical protein MARU1_000864 [Malassezia arunalokei]